jgi:hypothetical protein
VRASKWRSILRRSRRRYRIVWNTISSSVRDAKKENVRVIEHPKESLEIDPECVLEDKRIAIGGSLGELARRWGMGEFFAEKRRISCEKVAVDPE